MAKLILRYSAKHDPVSWWIRFKSGPGARHSHVEFLLPNGNTFGARFFGGVKERPISKRDRHVELTEVDVPCGEPAVAEALKAVDGRGYDRLWLLGFVTRSKAQDINKYSCSELVDAVLRMLGAPLLNDNRGWVSPRDLRLSPLQRDIRAIKKGRGTDG